MRKIPMIFFALLFAFPIESSSPFTLQEAMLHDLDTVKYTMEIKYAPKEWKSQHLGWNLEKAYQAAKTKIFEESPVTTDAYQKILKAFLKSTFDYHVNTTFYSTEWAGFPIEVKIVDNHYYIASFTLDFNMIPLCIFLGEFDYVDFERYDEAYSQLTVGDEVIAIDGIPIKEIINNKIVNQFGGHDTESTRGLAAKTLFQLRGQYGERVQSANFTITVFHQGHNTPMTYELPWLYFPEKIMNKSVATKESKNPLTSLLKKCFKKDFTVHYAKNCLQKPPQAFFDEEDVDIEFGDSREKGFLPALGEIIWESDSDEELFAYLYKNQEGKKIGYIYIPSFDFWDDADSSLDEMIEVLKIFNEESEALVLDITNNAGGNLFYMYAVLSLLTDKPLKVPVEREILIQEDVFNITMLLQMLESLQTLELDETLETTLWGYSYHQDMSSLISNYCKQIIHSWEEGKTLTDPVYIYGIEKVLPHPDMQYTKPILLLVNELDFSCADFFPAILQDNKRATLFGNKTAGAGGYVNTYPHFSRFGVATYSLTASIAFRENGNPIENLGVTPDVFYKCTKRDIREKYIDYKDAVNRQVEKIITPL